MPDPTFVVAAPAGDVAYGEAELADLLTVVRRARMASERAEWQRQRQGERPSGREPADIPATGGTGATGATAPTAG
jgi:hypothetical protein